MSHSSPRPSSDASRSPPAFTLCHLPATPYIRPDPTLPTVYLIRHGESEYNHFHSLFAQHAPNTTGTTPSVHFSASPLLSASDSNPDIVCVDAPLTRLGHMQAMTLRQELSSYASSHPSFHLDVIVSSPLSRAVQTTLIALADYHQQYYPPDAPPDTSQDYVQPDPIVLHPDCAEHCYCLSDIGRPLSALLPLFSHFAFDTAAFAGREEGWWFGASTYNRAVWSMVEKEYPDQMQRQLEMEIARSRAGDPTHSAEVKAELEEEKAQHGHELSHEQATHNSPRSRKASHHQVTTPAHHPSGVDGEGEAEVQVKDGKGQQLTIRLHPLVVHCEGDERLRQRLGRFLHFVCGFAGHQAVAVVCHSEVIRTLGQGWLENGEMVEMDWARIPDTVRTGGVRARAKPH